MAIHNEQQYIQAKTVTENHFFYILDHMRRKRIKFHGKYISAVKKASKDEDCEHKDVIVIFEDGSEEYFDAKHQDSNNKGKSSYSVSEDIRQWIDGSKFDSRYYFALMEYAPPRYSGNSWINQAGPTGRFALLPVKDCKLTRRDENTVVVDIFENGDLTEWISYDDETKLRLYLDGKLDLSLDDLRQIRLNLEEDIGCRLESKYWAAHGYTSREEWYEINGESLEEYDKSIDARQALFAKIEEMLGIRIEPAEYPE